MRDPQIDGHQIRFDPVNDDSTPTAHTGDRFPRGRRRRVPFTARRSGRLQTQAEQEAWRQFVRASHGTPADLHLDDQMRPRSGNSVGRRGRHVQSDGRATLGL